MGWPATTGAHADSLPGVVVAVVDWVWHRPDMSGEQSGDRQVAESLFRAVGKASGDDDAAVGAIVQVIHEVADYDTTEEVLLARWLTRAFRA